MIEAKVIADTVSRAGIRLTTLQLIYPRFIHAEMLTHRSFSRNASSSRAVPVAKMIRQVQENPAKPIHWGKNQPGMQAKEELNPHHRVLAELAWNFAAHQAAGTAEYLTGIGLHKQVANRILEPFQLIHVVVTATDWDNFFKLRCHADAQPEMQVLACAMRDAMSESAPVQSDVHLPYLSVDELGTLNKVGFEHLARISAARCARVSYINHDGTVPDVEKDLALAHKLKESGHMSPFEHQAQSLSDGSYCKNFRGWKQFRATIEAQQNGNCTGN